MQASSSVLETQILSYLFICGLLEGQYHQTEMQRSGSVLVLFYTFMILGKHCVLPGTISRPETSEEGGGGHHEQHSPNLQHKVTDDQEGIDEGSQTEE